MARDVRIETYRGSRDELRALFELAEDSAAELDSYIGSGRVLVAVSGAEVIGHLQLTATEDPRQAEIKNMAVRETRQGQGVGRRLVQAAVDLVAAESITTLLVATAAADIGNLRFYQRQGFRMRSIERDAFTPATGYPPGLCIDGIELRDRVWLDRAVLASGAGLPSRLPLAAHREARSHATREILPATEGDPDGCGLHPRAVRRPAGGAVQHRAGGPAVTDELALLDATAQAELVRTGQVTAAELVTAAIERIEALNPVLNAVVTPVFDRAAEAARAGPAGPFAGVPYLLKDLACEMQGVRFTEGSRFLASHVSAFDSELVVRLRRAGLVILGKTNTPEFGMAPACEPVLFGPARNPWDTQRSTSGSSGGSAAAVASGMVPFAHGNDLGGSLRYPASACGLFALKPTRARNPLGPEYGDVAAGGAAEHALTRSVRDSAALLDATSGPDVGDPYWAPPPARPFLAEVGADPGRLRIGYTTRTPDGDPGHPDCVAAAEHAARLCASLGHEVTETDWPGFTPEVGTAIGTMIGAAAAWILRYWIRHVGREPGEDEIEPLNRALWQAGEQTTAAQWLLAVGDVQRFGRRVARFFTGFDAFLTPTMSAPPLPIGTMVSTPADPWRSLQVSGQTVRYAGVVANLTGNPAMSVPLWWNDEGMPIGVHYLGRFGDEATLIRLAAQLETAQAWADRLPAVHAARPRVP